MGELIYRTLDRAEIPDAVELYVESASDMLTRHGLPVPPTLRSAAETTYPHIFNTGIFRVAQEEDGRLVAVCLGVVRDRLWFLSGFWVRVDSQRQGIGGPLLRQVLEDGRSRGADTFFTWSSVDLGALGGYLKMGMLPGYPVLQLAGPAAPAMCASTGDIEPLEQSTAVGVDCVIRGTGREADHRFWLSSRIPGYQVLHRGKLAGYFYSCAGKIGPAAWLPGVPAAVVLGPALATAREQAPLVQMVVPGINHDGIRHAIASGLSLVRVAHFVTSAPFGCLERYLSSGPALF